MVAMGLAAQTRTQLQLQLQLEKHVTEGFGSKSMELKWVRRRRTIKTSHTKSLFPIYISTDPRHVDPHRLRDLFADCNYSTRPQPEIVDIRKLSVALSHSAVIVSVFCNPQHVNAVPNHNSPIADFFTPVSPSRDQFIGFGRAVSDYGLTASIYDVMSLAGYSFHAENGNWSDDS